METIFTPIRAPPASTFCGCVFNLTQNFKKGDTGKFWRPQMNKMMRIVLAGYCSNCTQMNKIRSEKFSG